MSSLFIFEHIKHFMTQIVETELRCTSLALKREVSNVVGKYFTVYVRLYVAPLSCHVTKRLRSKVLPADAVTWPLIVFTLVVWLSKIMPSTPSGIFQLHSGLVTVVVPPLFFTPFTVNSNWHPSGTTI